MSLTERLQHFHEAIAWRGEIPLQSRYTLGLAGERFFRAIRDEGQFYAAYCPQCDYTYMPARLYCERCFAELTEWVKVEPRGTVYSYTVVHLDLDEQELDKPEVLACVRLDGCDGVLVHRLAEVDPVQLYIGMPVEAVLREKREGSIQDIAYFKPVQ